MTAKRTQFTLGRLMKAIAISAFVASVLTPLIRNVDGVLEYPGLFIVVILAVLLVQAPFLLLRYGVDWIFGNGTKRPDDDAA
ncbi:MAG: hypothetical protein U0795_11490 [Pirellulales bacterium]